MATRKGLEPSTSSVTGWHSKPTELPGHFGASAFPQKKDGGNNRARTCDPLLVRQMLSQLSYAPKPCTHDEAIASTFAHHRQMVSVRCCSCEPRRLCYHNTDSVVCQYPLQDFFEDFVRFLSPSASYLVSLSWVIGDKLSRGLSARPLVPFGIILGFSFMGDWRQAIKGAFRSPPCPLRHHTWFLFHG